MTRRSALLLLLLAAVLAGGWWWRRTTARRAFLDPSSLAGSRVDEAVARELFGSLRRKGSRMVFDPQAWVVLAPDRVHGMAWPEHPAGRITMASNERGLREDGPTPLVAPGLRVLAVGDSQTDATVDNDQTWPNVLERLLRAEGLEAEVLNAGVGATGPHNYLGMVRRHAELAPDLVVVGFYAGNDFLNALLVSDSFTKRPVKPRVQAYRETIAAVGERFPIIVAQGFNQEFLFRYREGDGEVALAASLAALDELGQVCEGLGADLLVALIPTKWEVDGDDDRERMEAILEALSIAPDDYGVHDRLADGLLAGLAQRGVPCVDPRPALAADPRVLFWRQDHHLSVVGHEALAAQLLEPVRTALEARGSDGR